MRRKSAEGKRSRDELISLARYGTVTPKQAEAEAKSNGWEPFEQQPHLPAFDPMQESRWSIVMSVAWIAWRDLQLVREQCPGFRSEATHWVYREWNEPVENGHSFAPRAGWFLETWSEATTVRLSLVDIVLKGKGELPPTRQLSVKEAEQALWQALERGSLVAEALNDEGRPVDIPQREWSFLKLYEEGKRDVLKYNALDRKEAFTQVKLKRDAILDLWPMASTYLEAPLDYSGLVDPIMIEPVSAVGSSGFVPLCCAIHWIMTDRGLRTMSLDDDMSWQAAVGKLLPLIQSEEIQLIGQRSGDPLTSQIPGHMLATIKVMAPFSRSLADIVLEAGSQIACSAFLGRELWLKDFNDCLYVTGRAKAAWTHLQVAKPQILDRWPRHEPRARPAHDCYQWLLELMQAAPGMRPKSKAAFLDEAKGRFFGLKERQFQRAWSKAISASGASGWSKPGPGRARSDRRGR
jgi:hypothetical protein